MTLPAAQTSASFPERQQGLDTDRAEDIFLQARLRLVRHFSIATAFIFLVFGSLYLAQGKILLGIVETGFGIFQLVNLLFFHRHHRLTITCRVLVYSTQFMSLLIFCSGGIGNTGNLWILFIPLFTLLLLKRGEARYALMAYSCCLALLIVAASNHLVELHFSYIELRQTLLVFGLFLYLTHHNEMAKTMVSDRLHRMNIELRHTTMTDHLTGLANRLSLNTKLAEEYARTQRYAQPLSIIIADLDHFKQINDTYGHLSGDEVLQKTADLFRKNTRTNDLVGRWGGEEFMIILPQTELAGATAMAVNLRKYLASTDFGFSKAVTASFGVCQYQQGDSLEHFLKLADSTLYKAKEAGRNCVISARLAEIN